MSAPDLDASDEAAVLEALRSGVLGLGPRAEEFERLLAAVAGTSHAVAVSSGTAGLHLIVDALGIGPGDEVLVPSFTFAASANAAIYQGATPVFVDIEPDTFNLDPAELVARRTPRTRAVMAVDVFGHPVDWDGVLAASEGLLVIDDCCEAIGATYKGRPLGGFGAAGCFAFYPNKQLTTGEGGADRHRRRGAGRAVPEPAQPGPRQDGVVAASRAARLQLPHGRALGGARRIADPPARHVPREAIRRRRDVRRAAAGPRGDPAAGGAPRRLDELVRVRGAPAGGHRSRACDRRAWRPRAFRAVPISSRCTCSPTSGSGSARARGCCPSRSRSPGGRWRCRSITA